MFGVFILCVVVDHSFSFWILLCCVNISWFIQSVFKGTWGAYILWILGIVLLGTCWSVFYGVYMFEYIFIRYNLRVWLLHTNMLYFRRYWVFQHCTNVSSSFICSITLSSFSLFNFSPSGEYYYILLCFHLCSFAFICDC